MLVGKECRFCIPLPDVLNKYVWAGVMKSPPLVSSAGHSDAGGPWATLAETWFSQTPSVGIWFISVPFELVVAVGCYGREEVAWLGERRWESHNFRAMFEGEITAF